VSVGTTTSAGSVNVPRGGGQAGNQQKGRDCRCGWHGCCWVGRTRL